MTDKEQILRGLNNIIHEVENFVKDKVPGQFIDKNKSADFQYVLSKLISFVDRISGIDRYFYNETYNIILNSKRQGGIFVMNIQQLIGHLKFLHDGLKNNLLQKIKNEISGTEIINFLSYANYYVNQNKKIESAIISTALYEDAIRKIGKIYSIEHKDLEQVINGLKSKGIISKTESQKFKYYSSIRNSALHAKWDEYEITDIKVLIDDLTEIIQNKIIQNAT